MSRELLAVLFLALPTSFMLALRWTHLQVSQLSLGRACWCKTATSFEPTAYVPDASPCFIIPGNNTDSDGDLVTYRIVRIWSNFTELPGLFQLDGKDQRALVLYGSVNYERQQYINVSIVATDNNLLQPLESSILVTVEVRNVNEAISIVSSLVAYITEDSPTVTAIYTVETDDVDGPTDTSFVRLTSVAETRFRLVGTVLFTAMTFNFEQQDPGGYFVGISASDRAFGSVAPEATFAAITVEVIVVDANDPPELVCGGTRMPANTTCVYSVPETVVVGSPVATLTFFDEDQHNVIAAPVASWNPLGFSSLTIANGSTVVSIPGPGLNYEVTCCVRCRTAVGGAQLVFNETTLEWVARPAGFSSTQCCPTVGTEALQLPQVANASVVGSSNWRFQMVTFNLTDTPPTFAPLTTRFNATFVVTGTHPLSHAAMLPPCASVGPMVDGRRMLSDPVALVPHRDTADVNEPPVFTSPLTASVPENVAVGTFVYGMTVAREDCNDAYSFAITAQQDGMFAVQTPQAFAVRTGALVVANAANFEAQSSYVVTLSVTDDSRIAPGKSGLCGLGSCASWLLQPTNVVFVSSFDVVWVFVGVGVFRVWGGVGWGVGGGEWRRGKLGVGSLSSAGCTSGKCHNRHRKGCGTLCPLHHVQVLCRRPFPSPYKSSTSTMHQFSRPQPSSPFTKTPLWELLSSSSTRLTKIGQSMGKCASS